MDISNDSPTTEPGPEAAAGDSPTGRRIRVGIDVGGTFTHAVAIDVATFALVGEVKVPTTHDDQRGVAGGIVESLFKLLEKGKISPVEIALIAHSTTQATNALLEGDVATVGIVGLASGMGRSIAKRQTRLGNIELAPRKYLHTHHRFLDTTRGLTRSQIAEAVESMRDEEGVEVIVASGAFSVEDPTHEHAVAAYCAENGILCTAACDISQLYGLKARTRTATINASMLPKMLETANLTEQSVREAGITSPLMIMRSDGGIMDIDQMRKRPILTMLSGPAAGVAAAMMYARITDGLFLEVGGTSTDISAIRNGKSLVASAVVGGHRLYLRTLDVRTLGVAGGSVPRTHGKHVVDAGPRSAHIAAVHYSAFEPALDTETPPAITVEHFQPKDGDPVDYIRMTAPGLEPFSVTPTCGSNLLGLVPDETDPARGRATGCRHAFGALAQFMGRPESDAEAVAHEMLAVGTKKVIAVVEDMMEDYQLDRELLTLSGGGGGSSAIVPFVAKQMGLPCERTPNSAVISAIGAALALVRDSIEKTVINPTDADILRIRQEAETAVVRMGASPSTVEIQIEIDAQKNILRAVATGATELRTRDLAKAKLEDSEILERVRRTLRGDVTELKEVGDGFGGLRIFEGTTQTKRLAGLFTVTENHHRLIDGEGIIRLQVRRSVAEAGTKNEIVGRLKEIFERFTAYGDGGREFPDLFLVFRGRVLDLSGLINVDQILALAGVELSQVGENEPVAAILKPAL